MFSIDVQKATTDVTVYLRVIDSSDGTPETGVAYDTAGIDLWYMREGADHTAITEASQTAAGAHTDGGFVHISDGVCRLDLPDAACASGVDHVYYGGTITGMIVIGGSINLVSYDPNDAVRMGMTALPNAAAEAAGGLFTRGTGAGQIDQDNNGEINVDVQKLGGSAIQQTSGHIHAYDDAGNALPAKTDVTGLNDLSAADVNAEVDTALSDYGPSTHSAADVWSVGARTLTSFGTLAADVWEIATAGLTTVGSIGKLIVDYLDAAISSRSSHSANDVTGGTTVATAETNIRGADDDTIKTVSDQLDGLNDLSAAQVNAEVVDALNVDTYAEPGQAAPAASPTIRQMLHYLYKSWRNKLTTTSTEVKLYDDAGTTVDQKATVSDDGTTFTRGEMGTGP